MKAPDNTEISENEINQPSFRQKIENFYEWMGCWAIHLMLVSGPFVFLYMCIKSPWQIFAVAYLLWMYYDRETPRRGGRRQKWLRKSRFWRHRKRYFPIELVKTAELPPDTTYLFASFPDEFFVLGASTNFLSDANHFVEKFPGLNAYVSSLNANFLAPFIREILLLFGVDGCSSNSILHVLNGPPGNVCVLTVGGMAEMMKSRPGDNRIVLKNRKGFVRLALKAGSSLVPVFTFGETNTYDQPLNSPWYRRIQKKSSIWPWRIGFFQRSLQTEPFIRTFTLSKTNHHLGKSIKLPEVENPSDELVDKFHKIFVQEMVQLFENHKSKYDSRAESAILNID